MEPIPETHEALEELERYGDVELRGDLQRLTEQAKEGVPGLVGVSLSLVTEDLVLTYVSSDVDIAALDAVQYTDDGPCLDAIRQEAIIETDTEALLDEGRWQLFAQASAAAGIHSSLSMPFRRQGVVTGGVNLYGERPDSFTGHVEQLADLFGAWAPGAVTNADLSFATRLEAVKSPERLRGQAHLDQAIGFLVAARGLEPRAAEDIIQTAAARAGVAVHVLARALVEALDPTADTENGCPRVGSPVHRSCRGEAPTPSRTLRGAAAGYPLGIVEAAARLSLVRGAPWISRFPEEHMQDRRWRVRDGGRADK